MGRWPVILGAIVGALVLLGVAVVVWSHMLLSSSWFKGFIEERISRATGAKSKIAGQIQGSIYPRPRLLIKGLALGGKGGAYSLNIEELDVGVSLGRFFFGRNAFEFLEARGMGIVVSVKKPPETNHPGEISSGEASPEDTASSPKKGEKEKVDWISYIIGASQVALKDIKVEVRNVDGPPIPPIFISKIRLEQVQEGTAKELSTVAKVENQSVEIRGWLKNQKEASNLLGWPFNLELNVPQRIAIRVEGEITPSPWREFKAVGKLEGQVSSVKDLLGKLNIRPPHLGPLRWGQVSLKGDFEISTGQAEIHKLNGVMDGFSFTGSIRATLGHGGGIWFDLRADELALNIKSPEFRKSETKEKMEKKGHPSSPKGNGNVPRLLSRSLPVEGQFQLNRLIVNGQLLENLRIVLSSKEGILSVPIFEAKIGRGSLQGNGLMDLQGTIPYVWARITTKEVELRSFLQGFAGTSFLNGLTNSEWELRGPWQGDLDQMSQSWEGTAHVLISSGIIHGVDIPKMTRSFGLLGRKEDSGKEARTSFSKAQGRLILQRGILKVSRGSLESEGLRIMAAGEADLINRTLDFRLEPEIGSQGEGDSSVLVTPIWVGGTFSKPSFKPDLAGIRKKGEGPVRLSLPSKRELKEMRKKFREFLKSK